MAYIVATGEKKEEENGTTTEGERKKIYERMIWGHQLRDPRQVNGSDKTQDGATEIWTFISG